MARSLASLVTFEICTREKKIAATASIIMCRLGLGINTLQDILIEVGNAMHLV